MREILSFLMLIFINLPFVALLNITEKIGEENISNKTIVLKNYRNNSYRDFKITNKNEFTIQNIPERKSIDIQYTNSPIKNYNSHRIYSTVKNNKLRQFPKQITNIKERKNGFTFYSRPKLRRTSTANFIEFYYLDKSNADILDKGNINFVNNVKRNNSSFYNFNDPLFNIPPSMFSTKSEKINSSTKINLKTGEYQNKELRYMHLKGEIPELHHQNKFKPRIKIPPENIFFMFLKKFGYNTSNLIPKKRQQYLSQAMQKQVFVQNQRTEKNKSHYQMNVTNISNINTINNTEPPYDKIRFFEIYDKYTPVSNKQYTNIIPNINGINNTTTAKNFWNISNQSIIFLKQNNSRKDKRHQSRYESYIQTTRSRKLNEFIKEDNRILNDSIVYISTGLIEVTTDKYTKFRKDIGEIANWQDYPFIAAYIHEPSRVRIEKLF